MARIVIVSGLQLASNPRVVKEADALTAAGHRVTVISALLDPTMKEREDTFGNRGWEVVRAADATAGGAGRIRWQRQRFRHRLAREMVSRLGIQLPAALGYSPKELLGLCRKNPAQLYILHHPQSFWVGRELQKAGACTAYDFEDWYSRDQPAEEQRYLPISLLEKCEKSALRHGIYCTTTSRAMAEALAEFGEVEPPAVIHNSFPWASRTALRGEVRDRRDPEIPSLYWFSQTTGPGRGLEILADAMTRVHEPVEIHLRGSCREEYRRELTARFPSHARGRLFFHPQVKEEEVLPRIAEHDLTLASELPQCPNRDLTIANKILLYLLAGKAVLASGTAGQREVAKESPGGVFLYPPKNAIELAAALRRLVQDPVLRKKAGKESLAAAQRKYHWETDQALLVEQVARALGRNP